MDASFKLGFGSVYNFSKLDKNTTRAGRLPLRGGKAKQMAVHKQADRQTDKVTDNGRETKKVTQ